MSMRSDSKNTQYVAVPASAAEDSSSAFRYLPAAIVTSGAHDIAHRAVYDPELGVSYSGESDVPDSEKAPETSRLTAVPRPSRDLPNERTDSRLASQSIRHHHYGQLVRLHTSALTMTRAVVMLKAVVPSKVPRRSMR